MAYFTSYFKAYFDVGSEPPPSPAGGGSLPSRWHTKRAKKWLRKLFGWDELKPKVKVKREKKAVEIEPLPEPRPVLTLSRQRVERGLDFEKVRRREEQKKIAVKTAESTVEAELLQLFEVERVKRKAQKAKKAKRIKEEIFLLLHL